MQPFHLFMTKLKLFYFQHDVGLHVHWPKLRPFSKTVRPLLASIHAFWYKSEDYLTLIQSHLSYWYYRLLTISRIGWMFYFQNVEFEKCCYQLSIKEIIIITRERNAIKADNLLMRHVMSSTIKIPGALPGALPGILWHIAASLWMDQTVCLENVWCTRPSLVYLIDFRCMGLRYKLWIFMKYYTKVHINYFQIQKSIQSIWIHD